MQEHEITICARCKHHYNKEDGPRTNVWYNWWCRHPNHERQLGVDPVTGEKCYFQKNSLGMIVTTDDKYPNCRDINHGYCEGYEAR